MGRLTVRLDGRECAASKCRARKIEFHALCLRSGCMLRFYSCDKHRDEVAKVFRHHQDAHNHQDAQPEEPE